MISSLKTLKILTPVLLVAVGAVQAQTTVFSDNYESTAANTDELAGWADTANLANYSLTVAAGTGMSGSQGLTWQADFTGSYTGTMPSNMGYSGGNPTGNTSANANDYILSFDMAVASGVVVNQLQLSLHGWADQWFSGTQSSTSGNIDTSGVSVGSGFQHITMNLGTFNTANSGSFNPMDQTYQFQFQLNGWQIAGGGPVTGQNMTVDNLQVQIVPEPSTLALAGFGAASLLAIRRRKA